MVLFSFLGYMGDDDMASEPEQSRSALIGCRWCHPWASNAWEKHQGLTVFLTFLSSLLLLSFFPFFYLPNTKPHFHTNSEFGASYPSNVITKGSRWPSHRPVLLWLHAQCQLSARGFCAASHWLLLLCNFLSLEKPFPVLPFCNPDDQHLSNPTARTNPNWRSLTVGVGLANKTQT